MSSTYPLNDGLTDGVFDWNEELILDINEFICIVY